MKKEEIKIHQICVITGTRAEYGLLRQILFKLKKYEDIDLKLAVTGSHLSPRFGNTQNEIIKDGFDDFYRVVIPMEDDSKEGMAVSTGIAMTKFAELFSNYKPDIVLVLGDRFEIFAAVAAAHLIGIPVAHISGGDITEGAVDDAIRHCLTKMSSLHFPGCEQSAKRIIQMGEQPDRVYNVGELGVENCLNIPFIRRSELAIDLNYRNIMGDYCVVTFHPVTMETNTAAIQVYELIKAMDSLKGMSYVITMANADASGRQINDIWIKEGKKRPNWLVVSSLGVLRYLSAMKYAKAVIGNSSSGVIEAPSMGTPTVNIGDRQKGRMMSDSVVCCSPEKEMIEKTLGIVLTDDFQEKAKHVISPFGDGTTSSQIVKIIMEFLNNDIEINRKHFYDIKFTI